METLTTAGTTGLWIGTYPGAGAGTPSGTGEGIWRVDLDRATGALHGARLVVRTPAPSFLATHPGGRVLYALAEDAPGTVTAFAVDADGGLTARSVVGAGGDHPCHLHLSPDARTLYVATYSSGTLGILPLDPDGSFAAEVLATGGPVQVLGHTGSGPRADRQEGPHAHFVASAPGGDRLLVCDLGTDSLRRYRVGADGRLMPDGVAAHLPPGTGPRHLAVGPAGSPGSPGPDGAEGEHHLYLAGELDGTVRVLRWDAASATATLVQTVPATGSPVGAASAAGPAGGTADGTAGGTADGRADGPADGTADRDSPLPSHVVLDGGRLVLAVRGPDVLVTWPVDPATGLLGAASRGPAGGAWPRHLAVLGDLAVVAGQGSGDLAVVRLTPGGGTPAVVGSVPVPSPACVVPVVA